MLWIGVETADETGDGGGSRSGGNNNSRVKVERKTRTKKNDGREDRVVAQTRERERN